MYHLGVVSWLIRAYKGSFLLVSMAWREFPTGKAVIYGAISYSLLIHTILLIMH